MSIFLCFTSIRRAAEALANHTVWQALAESPLYLYICHNCTRRPARFSVDPVAVISSLIWVRDRHFATVVEFVLSQSDTGLVNDRLIASIPRVLEAFVPPEHLLRHKHYYQPRSGCPEHLSDVS
jgi:hypothetical protein